ncbi:MAG TPA: threonine/serine dehydratase [Thermomicrobiaceae bacterium]|nr:threonine/serine dehydratase [Thermomicrobiaceae bacterium]
MVEFGDILAAREAISGKVRQTPVFSATRIGQRAGVRLQLKAELLQKTGSFKARGALNAILHTPREQLARGVIAVSAGNHAQGLAWAARQAGVRCVIVMAASASRAKIAATEGYGAEVVLVEGGVTASFERAAELERAEGLVNIHGFDNPLIIAGQGTVGLEIMEQVPGVELIVCPVGGGGLISGVALAAKSLKPSVRVYGVEPEGASAMRQSWDRGEPVTLSSVNTIADGLAPPMAGRLTYPLTRRYVDDIVTVSDEEIATGLRAILTEAKLYAEPSGAAATAALLADKIPHQPGELTVAIVSGGNMDLERLKTLI